MKPKTENLARCIQTLRASLDMLQRADPASIEYEIYRNATSKGFELVLETTGKLLRKAIKPYFASSRMADELDFKDLFRYVAKHGLLGLDEVERWFSYRDNRNTTAHDYGEIFAEETLRLLPKFIADAERLRKRI
uniref:Nucleotidyltransferase substrate binding protein like n=1 Tax=Candidatus Kentrum sp. LPFa TaxID=2126335 RepID=A0A450XGR9_9GAMM|nr:MAG: Nucleotidyltransferase substrate binding protein like [Candidatus Kentron sp. LPFa]VFK28502.1 MAG: Nucleotidyltransferase substrate binding protein like [Candidatus Kentron sp. LPFa]